MILNIMECEYTNSTKFLEDISKYQTVDKYLKAVFDSITMADAKDKPQFIPANLVVYLKNKKYVLINEQKVSLLDAYALVDTISKLGKSYRSFVNDIIEIEADYFEYDLVIYMDGTENLEK